MKRSLWIAGAVAVTFWGWGVESAGAATILFNWVLNVDGTTAEGWFGDPLPAGVDGSAFDFSTGLGDLVVPVSGPGSHYVGLHLDHDIEDSSTSTYYDETGGATGTPEPGQSWEIDEPGFASDGGAGPYTGDIYFNIYAGTLDNLAFYDGVTGDSLSVYEDPIVDDVSLALAWDFTLGLNQYAVVRFSVTPNAPPSGFYLQQADPPTGTTLYFSSNLQVVPEPGTLLLVGSGLAGLAGWRRRRRART